MRRIFLILPVLFGCATVGGDDRLAQFAADALGRYDNAAQIAYAPAGAVAQRHLTLTTTSDPHRLDASWRDGADGVSVARVWSFAVNASRSPTLSLGGPCVLLLERTGRGTWDARVDAHDCPLPENRAYQARVTLTPTAILFEERTIARDDDARPRTPPLDLRRVPC
jgi:hypothetical protein